MNRLLPTLDAARLRKLLANQGPGTADIAAFLERFAEPETCLDV